MVLTAKVPLPTNSCRPILFIPRLSLKQSSWKFSETYIFTAPAGFLPCAVPVQPHGDSKEVVSHHGVTSPQGGGDGDDRGGLGGGSGGGGADPPPEGPAPAPGGPQPQQYPTWLKVWLWATALFYLYARTRWRADLEEKMKEMRRGEELDERGEQEWSRFQEDYRAGQTSPGSSSK